MTSNLTKHGWPRPVVNGWPVPWVSPAHNLAIMDDKRTRKILNKLICQVCGSGHKATDRVFFCVNALDKDKQKPNALGDFKEFYQSIIVVMDHGLMHERCVKLAVNVCPMLKKIGDRAELFVFSAQRDTVRIGPATTHKKTFGFHVDDCRFEEAYSKIRPELKAV